MSIRRSHLPVSWDQIQWNTIVKAELAKFNSAKTRICIFLDNSTARIYRHLHKMGFKTYVVPTAKYMLILPDGSILKKCDLYSARHPVADVLISGCTEYNRGGYVYTGYPRMIDIYGLLSARGLITSKTIRIALASSGQEYNGIGNRSRMLFRANTILTPEKGLVRLPARQPSSVMNTAVSSIASIVTAQVSPANTVVVPAAGVTQK